MKSAWVVLTILIAGLLFLACSKNSRDDSDMIREQSIQDVKGLPQAPIPPDSLQLDSLEKAGSL